MNILDLRTVLFGYSISNAICAMVMFTLWLQNRKRSAGLGFWLADFIMQLLAVLLILLRGTIPDFISIILGFILAIGGTLLLYMGLERYVGKISSQRFNFLLLIFFVFVHAYFTYANPSLKVRNINLSVGLLAICSQSAWLMLRRVDLEMRPATRAVGVVFAAYSLVNFIRIFVDSVIQPAHDLFKSGLYDTLVILTYQMLFIGLTFALILMTNRRLFGELENDINKRKKSEEKISIAFQNIPDALIITAISDGKIIEVNESFFRITEFSKEEILGKTTIDLNLWGDPSDRQKYIDRLQQDGKILNFEANFRKKSGVLFIGLLSAEMIQLPEGMCVLNVISDISERKRAEQEIKRIASFPLLNPNPVLEVDSSGQITFTNSAVHTTLSGLGLDDPHALLPADIDELLLNQELIADTVYQREVKLAECVFAETISFAPTFQSWRIYATDITERKRTEEVLKETRDYLDSLIGYANAPIITWNTAIRITRFNHAFERLTGYAAEEVVGQELQMLFPEVSREESMAKIARTSGGEYWESVEIPILRKDGETRIALWNSANVYAADGTTLLATIAQGQDITERKLAVEKAQTAQVELRRLLAEADRSRRTLLSVVEDQKTAEEEIRTLNAELEQRVTERTAQLEAANKELQAFAYSVSHDLRAPLRSIDGWSLALLEDYGPQLDGQAHQYLNRVRDETQHMGQLIDDLLRLSRVSRTEMQLGPVNLSALAKTITEHFQEEQPERRFEFIIQPNLTVRCDSHLLEIALTNLIGNAVKFTGPRALARIEFGKTQIEDITTYFIRDNGVGFDMASAKNLFGAFQRLHRQADFPGTGIGLATVQRVIHRHGGTIWAEANIDQGATFYFTLEDLA